MTRSDNPQKAMDDEQVLVIIAYILNALAYLCCVFVAGVITHNAGAWKASLLAMGLCCIAYMLRLSSYDGKALIAVSIGSWAVGITAGLMILFS